MQLQILVTISEVSGIVPPSPLYHLKIYTNIVALWLHRHFIILK